MHVLTCGNKTIHFFQKSTFLAEKRFCNTLKTLAHENKPGCKIYDLVYGVQFGTKLNNSILIL